MRVRYLLLMIGTVLVIFYNLNLQNKKIETSAYVAIQERIEENICGLTIEQKMLIPWFK